VFIKNKKAQFWASPSKSRRDHSEKKTRGRRKIKRSFWVVSETKEGSDLPKKEGRGRRETANSPTKEKERTISNPGEFRKDTVVHECKGGVAQNSGKTRKANVS